MWTLAPGILLAAGVGALGHWGAFYLPTLGDVTLAIALGLLIGNLRNLPAALNPGLEFSERQFLALSVILMGFSLNASTVRDLGFASILFIFSLIMLTLGCGWVMARFFGLTSSLGGLLGMGNAICGASAIAATSPFLTRDKEEVGISVSVVNLIGTLGIFFLPLMARLVNFNEQQTSLFIGASLQAVGHVVAAGYAVSDRVGEMATAVKMGRICLLAPAILILAYTKRADAAVPRTRLPRLPIYLYGFMGCALLNNLDWVSTPIKSQLLNLSHVLMLAAMAGIGLRIKLATLCSQGPRALAFGSFIFLVQVLSLMAGLGLFFSHPLS